MDTKTRYSELEKEAKAVKWGVLFKIDTSKTISIPASQKASALLRSGQMRLHLQEGHHGGSASGTARSSPVVRASCKRK